LPFGSRFCLTFCDTADPEEANAVADVQQLSFTGVNDVAGAKVG